jgi:hypothetical protein
MKIAGIAPLGSSGPPESSTVVEHTEAPLVGPAAAHLSRQQHQSGAGPEDRHAGADHRRHRVEQSRGGQQERQGGGLAARKDEAVEPVQVGLGQHRAPGHAEPAEGGQVLADVPLEGQYADRHDRHRRLAVTNRDRRSVRSAIPDLRPASPHRDHG